MTLSRRLLRPLLWEFALLSLVVAVAGCGASRDARKSTVDHLEPLRTPTAKECELPGRPLASQKRISSVPKPGVYRYATRGRRSAIGSSSRSEPIDGVTSFAVTHALRLGRSQCYRSQWRYSPQTGETTTIVTGGRRAMTGEVTAQSPGSKVTMRPDQPIASPSGEQLDVSGRFTGRIDAVTPTVDYHGPAIGQYAISVIGRKTMHVRHRKVAVIGVESRLSFAGSDVSASQSSVTWLAPREGLIVSTDIRESHDLGSSRVRTAIRSRLLSLEPTGASPAGDASR
jgi:hypothetical protein